MPETLTGLQQQVNEELRPATALERIFAREIAYASWELDRVRALTNKKDAEPALNAAYSRASRNWTRARKELQRLQTARTNRLTRVQEGHRAHISLFPMADPGRVPTVKPVSKDMMGLAIDAEIRARAQQEEN